MLPRDRKYWTVVQYDDGPMVDFPFDCKVFAAGGKPDNAVAIPLVSDPLPIVPDLPKNLFCSMMCRINTHPIREKLIKALVNKEVVINEIYGPEYAKVIQGSKFTICPRGYGKTSFRLYEAIQLGTIPVYVSEEFWLPYSDKLDWNSFCVLIEEKQIPHIYDILKGINEDRYEEMMMNLLAVQDLFTYEGTFSAIKGILENE